MLWGSVIIIMAWFIGLVAECMMGATAEEIHDEVGIFIGINLMAIFLNVWLHYEIKDLEKDNDIYEYE